MALQYLSDIDGEVMTHDFMNAGQNCLDVLERLGEVKTNDSVYYVFTEEK